MKRHPIARYFEEHGLVFGVFWICLAVSLLSYTIIDIVREASR